MFIGSIPAELRSIVAEHIATWQPTDLYVGCSGNFTIERAAHDVNPAIRLHGNDVSIYTCALGAYLSGKPVKLGVNPDSMDQLGWFAPYFDGGSGSIAALMLATRFLEAVDRADNPYFARMLDGYQTQFPQLHAATKAKIDAITTRLESFHPQDVRAWLRDRVPVDAAVMSFPPFYKAGYTKLYAALDEHLTWPTPSFDEMDRDDVLTLIDDYTTRRQWMLGLPEPFEALEEFKTGVVQTSIRNIPIYVYSSEGRRRVARARQLAAPVFAPRLARSDELGGRLALAPLSAQQFTALRAQYLSRKIAPGGAALAVGVLVDGKLVGCFAANRPSFDPASVYLLSDFPVAPTNYKNLAKLVLVAAMSTEARLLMERSMSRRLRHVSTTAFTDRPASMKYRGLLKLDARKDATDGVHRYMINYSADLGRWTLAEGFQMWRDRWGQTRENT